MTRAKAKRLTKQELFQLRTAMVMQFPECFAAKGATKKPLKIGIHKDLYDRARKAFPGLSLRFMRGFLSDYVSGHNYLVSLKPGAARVDLDGNFSGFVTKEQADRATRQNVELKRRYAKYLAGKQAKAVETPEQRLDRLKTAFANAEQSDNRFYTSGKASKLQAEISVAQKAVDAAKTGVPA